jgi:hypothetical protein
VDDIALPPRTENADPAAHLAHQPTYPNGLRAPASVERSNGSPAATEDPTPGPSTD